MAVLEVRNLSHCYGAKTQMQVFAVKNVSLRVEAGELLGVIGHTGSGKSTLIQHFNGLLTPTSGEVLLDGENIFKDKATTHAARFRVGMCFQYPEYQLFEETVYKDISFGPRNMKLSDDEIDRRVRKAAQFVGLPDALLEKSPFDLSGGEKRRAAIAGVMAMEPEILVLDEPTAGLDPRGRDTILRLVEHYRTETGSTVILVSHSMEDIARMATKALVMNRGEAALYGTVDEVFSQGDKLVSMGLDVPAVTRIFLSLHDRGVPVRMLLRSLRPVAFILLFTAVLNLFYTKTGSVLFQWKFLILTDKGLYTAVFMAVRILSLVSVSALLTYTTTPTALTDGIEKLLSPLKLIKVPVHSLAMMMTLALRFIPTLIEEIDRIMSAQKARGADLETGGFIQRAKALLPVLIPLFVSAFRRAYELAFAMECRCYRGGEGRTRMKQMKLGVRDAVTAVCFVLLIAGVVLLGRFFPAVI